MDQSSSSVTCVSNSVGQIQSMKSFIDSCFAFLRPELDSYLYGKMARYIISCFDHCQISYRLVDNVESVNPTDVVVIFYDYLVNHFERRSQEHEKYIQRFILVEIEPQLNMDQPHRKKFLKEHGCLGIITFTKTEGIWLQKAYKDICPTFIVCQSFSPEEDTITVTKFKRSTSSTSTPQSQEKSSDDASEYWLESEGDFTCDILMPGCTNTEDRCKVVQELREAGLRVNTDFVTFKEQDEAIRRCKIYAYYPATKEHLHFASQRVLWTVNKGGCVVSVVSGDPWMEIFYDKLFIPCTRENFVRTCKEIIEQKRWKTFRKDAYHWFKNNIKDMKTTFIESGLPEFLANVLHHCN